MYPLPKNLYNLYMNTQLFVKPLNLVLMHESLIHPHFDGTCESQVPISMHFVLWSLRGFVLSYGLLNAGFCTLISKSVPSGILKRSYYKGSGTSNFHPSSQCRGRFLGIIGQDPSVPKCNWLFIEPFRFFFH